jgi:glutamate dehydrogenase/leucine dehydrogenase
MEYFMDDTVFRFCDDLGPKSILHLYQPTIGLKGIVVVDNVAAGPSIGGVRMAPDVSLEECFRLARAMTFKNAAAGLPHGGGKSVIFKNSLSGHLPRLSNRSLTTSPDRTWARTKRRWPG